MRVRLAFAVAAHLEPEILILDEVLAVGDAAFQEKCLEKIEATKNSGVTILFVSHSAASVRQLCNRAIVLKDGKIVYNGKAKEGTDYYMQSLHLHSNPDSSIGFTSRRGELIGAIGALLARELPHGHVIVDVPIETHDGLRIADVAWISSARRSTLCRDPAYSGAPEICVHLPGPDRAESEVHKTMGILFKVGAMENWLCDPLGNLRVLQSHHYNKEKLVANLPEKLSLD